MQSRTGGVAGESGQSRSNRMFRPAGAYFFTPVIFYKCGATLLLKSRLLSSIVNFIVETEAITHRRFFKHRRGAAFSPRVLTLGKCDSI